MAGGQSNKGGRRSKPTGVQQQWCGKEAASKAMTEAGVAEAEGWPKTRTDGTRVSGKMRVQGVATSTPVGSRSSDFLSGLFVIVSCPLKQG
ncbi:hypothetical protein SUGI_0526350 [Cryptomeria japonica]|nr:hypothetical protein SUGI_0526350 [Cryptomeria japonica]